MKCIFMYWPLDYPGGMQNFLLYLLWNFLTLYNYFLSAFKGPGFVPFEWRPVSIYMYLLFNDIFNIKVFDIL